MRHSVWLWLLAACGSVTAEKQDAAPGGGDAPKSDAAMGAGACDVTKPFGTPARVSGLNGGDTSGWMSADQLTIYFTRSNSTTHDDIWTGTRASTSDAFGNLTAVAGVNTSDFERQAAVPGDGLSIFLGVYEITGSVFSIKVSTRNSTTAQFGAVSTVANINMSGTGDGTPWISADGLAIYFSSTRVSNNYDIYRATRTSTSSTFGQPTAVGELNSPAIDDYPVLSADGLEVFIGSQRNQTGSMYLQIWHATRSTVADGFSAPTEVTELNVADNTYPNWLSPDRCTLMFTSKRPNGSGSQDLWIATRPH